MEGIVIGMDEAGYGPNLGPLVITATVWETPVPPSGCSFWDELAPAVRNVASRNTAARDERIFVADSKAVYQPGKGLAELERSVLCLLGVTGHRPETFEQLQHGVAAEPLQNTLDNSRATASPLAPWYQRQDLAIPLAASLADVGVRTERLSAAMQTSGLRLRRVACDVVTEARFNELIETCGNKAAALTERSLRLLRSVWPEDESVPVCVYADKHGGRNQYAGALSHVFEGRMPVVEEESTACSRYRMGTCEFSFRARGESQMPVAAASMVSKYVREVAMTAFNRFWQSHLPDLKPTAGYPVDAKRFLRDIAPTQQILGISSFLLWRSR